jgi:hypothetical protein
MADSGISMVVTGQELNFFLSLLPGLSSAPTIHLQILEFHPNLHPKSNLSRWSSRLRRLFTGTSVRCSTNMALEGAALAVLRHKNRPGFNFSFGRLVLLFCWLIFCRGGSSNSSWRGSNVLGVVMSGEDLECFCLGLGRQE